MTSLWSEIRSGFKLKNRVAHPHHEFSGVPPPAALQLSHHPVSSGSFRVFLNEKESTRLCLNDVKPLRSAQPKLLDWAVFFSLVKPFFFSECEPQTTSSPSGWSRERGNRAKRAKVKNKKPWGSFPSRPFRSPSPAAVYASLRLQTVFTHVSSIYATKESVYI